MKIKRKHFGAAIQTVLLVGAIFSFSYLAGRALNIQEVSAAETSTPDLSSGAGRSQNSNSVSPDLVTNLLVSLASNKGFGGLPNLGAIDPRQILQSIIDSTDGGISICTETKDHKICQTYQTKDCEEICAGKCVQIASVNSAKNNDWPKECKLGMCLDEEVGTCEPRSPFDKCETTGGKWLEPNSNDARCRKGCCFLKDQGQFVTEQQCRAQAVSKGLEFGSDEANFDSAISGEPECLALAMSNADDLGACTFFTSDSDKKDCKLTRYDECTLLRGEYSVGKLCSNPDLNTNCEKMNNTACDDEMNAVYWYDSCGNRENIFDGSKADYGWNDGKILPKADSCLAKDNDGIVSKQNSCGNCYYPAGTKCGAEVSGQELNDKPDGGVVCRSLGCVDSATGERRNSGESWCAYQGKVGTGELNIPFLGLGSQLFGNSFGPLAGLLGGQSGRDTPGSRHFRLDCFEGEISEVPCQDYRNEVCVQEDSEEGFSQAACRINRWQECLNYNPTQSKGGGLGKAQVISAMTKCELDPDCFVKYVNVDKDFSFPVCVPKYSPGFDQDNLGLAKQICSYASQVCNVVYVKEITGWKCKANCDCEKEKFVEEMNDVCMSLGDCGMNVNYMGSMGVGGYSVKQKGSFMPKIKNPGPMYALRILGNSEAVKGWFIKAEKDYEKSIGASSNEFLGGLLPAGTQTGGGGLGNPIAGTGRKPNTGSLDSASKGGINAAMITGATGTVIGGAAMLAGTAVPVMISAGGITYVSAGAFMGVFAGAAAGMGAAALMLQMTGVGRGLSPAMSYGLMGAAAVGGAIVGLQVAAIASTSATLGDALAVMCTGTGGVGCIIVVVVIIIIALMAAFGIGDIQVKEYTFQCNPWQPPLGGSKCELCGSDDAKGLNDNLQCSKYACESLGQSCKFIDDEPNSYCVDASPNDASGPRISEWSGGLSEGFKYEAITENGFKVRHGEGEECLGQFESVQFGVNLNEMGRCKIAGDSFTNFEDMIDINGGVLGRNHNYIVGYNDLETLVEKGFQSEKKTEVNLYVKCEDVNGNPSPGDYIVNFCVWPEDLTAPAIVVVEPSTDFVQHDLEKREVTIVTNEKADVKWSFDDKEFEEMENLFVCDNEGVCKATIPLSDGETKICIKAQDHPEWKGTGKESKRNTDSECKWFSISKTESDLNIDSVRPSDGEVIIGGLEINTIYLEVVTSGGYEGTVSCAYSLDGQPYASFAAPIGNTHSAMFNRITSEGEYTFDILCFDSAGNNATESTTFTVKKDLTAPIVARVYNELGTLVVVTDEPSTCAFVNEKISKNIDVCGFAFVNGTQMVGEGLEHKFGFDTSKIYYIRCKDAFNNINGKCSKIVSGGMF